MKYFNIIFQHNPKYTDPFVLLWHKLQNSMTVEISLLHSLPFMNIHVYDLGNLFTEQPTYPSNSCYEVFN